MRLPPLNALRAFEAAARHGGYIDAAEELHVTRGAISRHVKSLEDHLGVPLFRRHSRGVELNEAGKALQPILADAFKRIADGVETVTATPADLRIICPPATSVRWLMPRLDEFRSRHPEIGLQLTTDYMSGGYDPSRYNLGFSVENWQARRDSVCVEPLAPLVITPACTPDLAMRLAAPEDLANVRLLHESHDRFDWTSWNSVFRIPGLDVLSGDTFHNLDMAIQAALLGNGVVMVDLFLARRELEAGTLVLPLPELMCDTPLGRFALLGGREDWEDPKVVAFRNWITDVGRTDTQAFFAGRDWTRVAQP